MLCSIGSAGSARLSASLGQYAFERMQAREHYFRLNVRVTDATATSVSLNTARRSETSTLVWTAGFGTNPPCYVRSICHATNAVLRPWNGRLP